VWGNKNDGYEINNWSYEDFEPLKGTDNDKEILKRLKEIGFFKKHVRLNMITIEDQCNGMIMIYERKTHKPICCIEYPA